MRILAAIVMGGSLLLAGTGCSNFMASHSELDATWGDATRANREAMVQNPVAGSDEPVEGLDARSAEHVLENYSKNQEAQEHPRTGQSRGSGILIGEMQ